MPKAKRKTLKRVMRVRKAEAEARGHEFHLPLRDAIVKSKTRKLRELSSVKMHGYIPCESLIEFDHCTVLDVRRDVIRILGQPVEIFYTLDEKKRKTIPDFRIDLKDGSTEFHECRTDKEAMLDHIKLEKEAISMQCAQAGVRYVEVRESEVRLEPRLSNARMMRDERMRRRSLTTEWTVLRLLEKRSTLSLAEVCEGCLPHEVCQGDILAMALHGLLVINWETEPIGPDTKVTFPR